MNPTEPSNPPDTKPTAPRTMLGHLSLGVADIQRSRTFYDAIFGAIGVVPVWQSEGAVGYGFPGGGDKLALFEAKSHKGRLAAGPGFHLAFDAPSQEAVHQFFAAAMASGGRSVGAPGPRPDYGETYYAAFVIDPDGHKLEIVHQ